MALFGFGKDKKGGADAEQVLAYLEECQRARTAFTLVGPKKGEVAGTIQGIDEGAGTVTFQAPTMPGVDKGASVEFLFIQENLRIGASTRVAELRSGLWVLELPDSLELRERRSQPRARLNPKEGATLTALTGLFEGVGITGVVENISEGGARVRVEKAMNIKGEKRLPLGTALVPQGQPFMLVKLNKIPKCPAAMELEGRAAYLDGSGGGLVLGLAFSKPRSDFAAALRGLVASRTSAIPSALPAKTRRRPEAAPQEPRPASDSAPATAANGAATPPSRAAEEPAGLAPAPAGSTSAPALDVTVPPPMPAAGVPAAPPEPPPAAPEEAPAPAPVRNDPILRLRKRSRAVVALASSPAAADLLKEHLQEEGYGRVLATGLSRDLFDLLQQPNLGILFLDGNLGPLDGLALVNQLRGQFSTLPPIVLAVEDASTAIVLAARRSGVAQVLVKPYNLDATFTELLDQLI